jgi:hypothetical protein
MLRLVPLLVLLSLTGCVRRELTVTSEPEGALVRLNGREAGRTPFTTDFTWYGTYDVEVEKPGYQTLVTKERLVAPVWQWPPFDLAAEFAPWRPVDKQSMHFALTQRHDQTLSEVELVERARELRDQTRPAEVLPPSP